MRQSHLSPTLTVAAVTSSGDAVDTLEGLSSREDECPQPERAWSARATSWVCGLTPSQIARAKDTLLERRYTTGSTIFQRGQKLSHWCGVINGLLRLSRDTPRGKTIVTFPGLAGGTWFGEDALLHDTALAHDVVALRDTRLALLPRPTFIWLLGESIAFNRFVIHQLSARMSRFVEQLELGGMRDGEARIARCLAAMVNGQAPGTTQLEIHISQKELGHLAGTSRQRTNLAVQRLRQKRLLRTDYCKITVLDLPGLRTYGAQDAHDCSD